MKLVYNISADANLNYMLALVYEIRSETGLVPEQIITADNRSVCFDLQDWKRLNRGDISEEDLSADTLFLNKFLYLCIGLSY